MNPLNRTVFTLLLLILISVATSTAQTLKTSGTLEGTISDATGGRIPGAKVSLRQIETNQTRTVSTDDQGFFRATDLVVGAYEVRVDDSGFAPYLHTGVGIGLGTTVHLDVDLQAAGVTTQVTVSAQPPPIDPSQTSVTSAVDRQKIEDLPVRSRNALDFVLEIRAKSGRHCRACLIIFSNYCQGSRLHRLNVPEPGYGSRAV